VGRWRRVDLARVIKARFNVILAERSVRRLGFRCKRLDLRFPTLPDEIAACHSSLGAKSWGQVLLDRIDPFDRDGGMLVVSTLFGMSPFLKKLFADGGYQGPFKRLWPRRFGTSRSKSSNARIARLRGSPTALGRRWLGTLALRALSPARRSPRQRTLFDGASGLLRSTAAGDWPRTLPTSLAMPWRSSVLPRSASCCENSAIHNQLSRSTLTK
jgi:hypothetical protein